MKTTPEGISKNFEVIIFARKSKTPRSHELNINNILLSGSIFSFLKKIIKTPKSEEAKYFIFSISPFTFFACIFIKLFKRKPIVYLRSDGYKEYKAIFGFLGPIIYHFMFIIISKISHLISCRKYILRNKVGNIVHPSQLDEDWLRNLKEINFDKIKLLYVGRVKVEKGIFSLIDIIKDNNEISLSIVGAEKKSLNSINQSNVKVYEIENNKQKLIKPKLQGLHAKTTKRDDSQPSDKWNYAIPPLIGRLAACRSLCAKYCASKEPFGQQKAIILVR